MTFTRPEPVPAGHIQVGDYLAGRNCTVKLVRKHASSLGGFVFILIPAIPLLDANELGYRACRFEVDQCVPRVLSVAEAFSGWTKQ